MKQLFERIRQLILPRGVWVAYHYDFSGFAFFDEELLARRYAGENNMGVEFCPYGVDVRQELLRRGAP